MTTHICSFQPTLSAADKRWSWNRRSGEVSAKETLAHAKGLSRDESNRSRSCWSTDAYATVISAIVLNNNLQYSSKPSFTRHSQRRNQRERNTYVTIETRQSLTNHATRLQVIQGHQTWYHSICYVWFPISVSCNVSLGSLLLNVLEAPPPVLTDDDGMSLTLVARYPWTGLVVMKNDRVISVCNVVFTRSPISDGRVIIRTRTQR